MIVLFRRIIAIRLPFYGNFLDQSGLKKLIQIIVYRRQNHGRIVQLQPFKYLIDGQVRMRGVDDMINGLKALAVVYSGAASYIISENEDMAYCEPYQGTNIWSDAMCIPSNAKNVKLAHAWTNFNLEKEVAIDNSLYVGYTSGNKLALEELSNGEFKDISSYKIRTGYQLDEEYRDDESLKKTLGELWTHVKAGN